jgi:Bacterial protein of unknown function (DUF885)
MSIRLAATLVLGAWLILTVPVATSAASVPATPFASLVDIYLDGFGRFHPSIAAGNGLHAHDGELEDFSVRSVAAEIKWLHAMRARLDAIAEQPLSADERVDRRILQGVVDGWLLDLETIKNWSRNPMIYVAAISDGLHNLATMDAAPADTRMRQAISKMHAIPRLLESARRNIKAPPRVFVENAIGMLGGVEELLSRDLQLAFGGAGDAALRQQLAAAAREAARGIVEYRRELETRGLAAASGEFAIGTAAVEARYRAEELIDLPADRLLAIGERELARNQAEFTRTAARIDATRTPIQVWGELARHHPARGELVAAAAAQVDELFAFIAAKNLLAMPASEHIVVAPAPAYDIGLASMHSSPPLEARPVQSYYYITDADPAWPLERQNAWLESFNFATLADITAHEVVPGHYVHSVFMRRTPGRVRRIWIGLNPFPQPSSGQDGWAHYAEQLVSDEGFHAEDPRYRLAQTAEALNRICRLIAGLKLHSGAWSVDQATDFFEREAHLSRAHASREAVRGTYDPTYGGYFLGKLAALKLRQDYAAARGASFSLREFHERVMSNGIAPWWVHRQLLLPGDRGAVLE